DVVGAFFVEGFRERVGVMESRRVEAVEHEIHAADAKHGHAGIAVEAGEGAGLGEVPLVAFEAAAGEAMWPTFIVESEIARIGMRFKQVLPGVDKKAARTGGGIADAFAGP